MSLLHDSTLALLSLRRFGFSSSASPEADEKNATKKFENTSSNASEQDVVSHQRKSSVSDQEEESGFVSIALLRGLSSLNYLNRIK